MPTWIVILIGALIVATCKDAHLSFDDMPDSGVYKAPLKGPIGHMVAVDGRDVGEFWDWSPEACSVVLKACAESFEAEK